VGTATARVTILMDQADKQRLAQLARNAKMSVGEFVRGKALGVEDETTTLLAAVAESAARANAALDKALEAISRREAGSTERYAAIVAATRREFSRDEAATLGALLGFDTSATAA
jgi:hypothetical protein